MLLNMPEPSAIYRFRDSVFKADRCVPLNNAIDIGEVTFSGLARNGYPGQHLGEELAGLLSVGFWDVRKRSDWHLNEHRNEGIEVSYLESGKLPFLVNGKWHEMRAGDFAVTRPWQPHGLGNKVMPPCKLHWFIIDVGVRMPNQNWQWPDWIVLSNADLERLTLLFRQNETPFRKSDRLIADSFRRIRQVLESDSNQQAVSYIAVLTNAILVSMIELMETQNELLDSSLQSSRRAVEIFLSELSDHSDFLQREWTLAEMADECHIGRTVFSDLCKEITNQTPFEYLNHCRVSWATRALVGFPEKSITDIALEAGFCSSAYFTKNFKKAIGITPTQFRAKHL